MGFAFEYDRRKAESNLKKHGVSFRAALTVFDDPLAQTFPDDLHSEDESRSITIGFPDFTSKSTGGDTRPTIHSPNRVILYLRSKLERKAPRADDSLWIRVWPETASCRTMFYLFHRAPFFVSQARWLLWLVGRSNGILLAVQQQCFAPSSLPQAGQTQGNAESRIHTRNPRPLARSALLHPCNLSPLVKETLVYLIAYA